MRSVACYNKKRASVSKSRFVSTENMKQNCNGIEPYDEATSVDGVEFCQDDILLANIRPYLKKAWKAEFNGACSTDVLSIKPIGINADFFFHCIEKDDFFNYVMSAAKGSKMPRGDKQHIMEYTIHMPSEAEQRIISKFIELITKRISEQQKLVDSLKLYKRGVITAIFDRKFRFTKPDGTPYPEWSSVPFGDIIIEYNDRTKSENEDILLSAAIEGMFLNTELFGHQRGSSNIGYKKIKKGTLVLSTQNLHLGNANVNLRFEHGMVSPAYKTYHIKGCSQELMYHWIKREETKQFFFNATTVGASACRRNVEWETLYSQVIELPSIEEEVVVVRFLNAMDNICIQQETLLTQLLALKKTLLQQMFI